MEIDYPVRINRYLYLKGYCSRRKADQFIKSGKVKINGKPAEIGQQVHKDDEVTVATEVKELPKKYLYYAFNKPKNIVSHNARRFEKEVKDIFRPKVKVDVVGRLDKESHGLMLLTNDGRIVDKLLNPKYNHEKEYTVTVDKDLIPSFKRKMERGVNIEGYVTKPTRVELVNDRTFKIVLTEGKKHQIRRMCAALGYQVRDLKRTRIMNITLGNLKRGEERKLTEQEVGELLRTIGIQNPA